MIEWHKAKDKLPPYYMPVLVASKYGKEYPEDIMLVMKMIAWENNRNMWKCAYDSTLSPIYDDDHWAIINQPKMGKDGDSD